MRAFASTRLTAGLVLALAATIGTLIFGGNLVGGHDQPQVTNTTALLTTNRTGLKMCVQSLDPSADSRMVEGRLRGLLTKVSNHPDFRPAGLGREPVVVDVGCPAAPTILDPSYDGRRMSGAPITVTTPSQYRTFVFVASPEQLAGKFAWEPRLTPQEVLCEGHGCTEVTVAVYVTLDELTDPPTLERILTRAVGLWPVGEPRFDPKPLPANPNPPGQR